MRRLRAVAVLAVTLASCGGSEPTAFAGTWVGTKSILDAEGNVTASAAGITMAIEDQGHGTPVIDGRVTADVTETETSGATLSYRATYRLSRGAGAAAPTSL